MNKKEQDFYFKIRKDIKKWLDKNSDNQWAEYLLLAPDLFHLLVKLMMDNNVPTSKKVKLGAVIAYFISPIDLMPEALLGPLGFLDDIALAAFVLNDLLNEVDPQIVLKHWAGESDILYTIKNLLVNAKQMLGADIYTKLKNRFKI
jgi:uncharacterized membrane protein YkvA (DUF1232 family)